MDAPKEVQTPGEFKCELFELSALYTYCGWTSPKSHSIVLYHPAQVFYQSALDCSLFYSKSICLPCVKEHLKAFPLEIQEDMDKRKPAEILQENGYKA